jgi:uracil DNA glycosylase
MKRMYLKGQSPSKTEQRKLVASKHKIVIVLQGDFGMVPTYKPDKDKMPNHVWVFLTEMMNDLGWKRYPRSWDKRKLERNGILFLNTNYYKDDKIELYKLLSRHSFYSDKAVYMLLGKYAQRFVPVVARNKHLVIKTSSLMASYRNKGAPFLGTRPFSKACDFLGLSKDIWRFD